LGPRPGEVGQGGLKVCAFDDEDYYIPKKLPDVKPLRVKRV